MPADGKLLPSDISLYYLLNKFQDYVEVILQFYNINYQNFNYIRAGKSILKHVYLFTNS